MNISQATVSDIPSLVSLVNSAYRGESSKKGWTTEADLLEGLRTNEHALMTAINKPEAVILKYSIDANEITGCVYLQKQQKKLYLGMLTVSPGAQAKGIGKQLLAAAEEYAILHGCSYIIMNVISVRKELIEWYERQGYKKSQITKPFPPDTEFGTPKLPLEFVELEKGLK